MIINPQNQENDNQPKDDFARQVNTPKKQAKNDILNPQKDISDQRSKNGKNQNSDSNFDQHDAYLLVAKSTCISQNSH